MNLCDIIEILYPDANKILDFLLQEQEDGTSLIHYWNAQKLGPQPTEQELLDQAPALQQQYDDMQADIARRAEYPKEHELIVALWESVVENDSTALNDLQQKRLAVKAKYPKSGA